MLSGLLASFHHSQASSTFQGQKIKDSQRIRWSISKAPVDSDYWRGEASRIQFDSPIYPFPFHSYFFLFVVVQLYKWLKDLIFLEIHARIWVFGMLNMIVQYYPMFEKTPTVQVKANTN